ncbi:uncharacterized protein si:dkey-246e1.3 isoform X1 [Pygocentrus nattereri]|uniref:uncharacterized protein si:dkey-246e1.3 isoform X1 n=1 Tax=Pygocentrus nattereri TaxID=42514 RepID=UPI001891D2B3|nr:uncharacterized protein si:dkey-246e1.3 isoform X1 [Pygocentrus nattereri]
MSASLSTASIGPSLNGTTGQDAETRAAIHEFRVFNMVILSLAVCVLTITAVICCVSYYSRRRWWCKRTGANECTGGGDSGAELVDMKVTKKRRSFRNPLALLRRQESTRVNSRIYYIYSNPLPVGHPEDEPSTPETPDTLTPLTLRDCAKDPESGIVLDPPIFYMQL